MAFTLLDATKKVAQRTRPEYQELKRRGNEFLEANFYDLTQTLAIPVFIDEDCENAWRQGLEIFCKAVRTSFSTKLENLNTKDSIQLKESEKATNIFNKFYAKALIESLQKVDESVSISIRRWIAQQISHCVHYPRDHFLEKVNQCIPTEIAKEHQNAIQFLVNLYSVTEGEEANILQSKIWMHVADEKLAYLFYTTLGSTSKKHEEKYKQIVIDIICALGEKHESLEGDLPVFLSAMNKISAGSPNVSKAVSKDVKSLNQALISTSCTVEARSSEDDEIDALFHQLRAAM